jgi:hypothetical protein
MNDDQFIEDRARDDNYNSMKMAEDQWIREKAKQEDGAFVGAGTTLPMIKGITLFMEISTPFQKPFIFRGQNVSVLCIGWVAIGFLKGSIVDIGTSRRADR